MEGILFSQMEPLREWEDEFNSWYETEHIPARLALEGFTGARRYRAVEGKPRYLALYEISDLGALETPGYRRLKESPSELTKRMLEHAIGFTRFICESMSDTGQNGGHDHLSVVAFAVPDDAVAGFDDWYASEHVPLLLEAPEWLRVRRYRIVSGDGGPWTHLALHELASREAMNSPEREAARRGPKRAALAEQDWFGQSGRWLYELISRHEKT